MKALVVYYSRTGNTKKVAWAIAEALKGKAEVTVEELVDTKSRQGILGWFRAGGDASLKRAVPIRPVQAHVAGFDLVVVGTPVWAFTMASAVRSFLVEHGANMQRSAFFCTMGGSGAKGAFAAMEQVSGKVPVATLVITEKQLRDEKTLSEKAKTFAAALNP